MKKAKTFLKRIYKLITEKYIFFYASAITFNLILCAIPFTLIFLSIVGYVISYDVAYQELLRFGQELLPRFMYDSGGETSIENALTLESILDPLIQKRRLFGILGITILTIFSQSLFSTLKHVIFQIFGIKERKHLVIELVYNFLTFGLVGGVFIFSSITLSILSLITIDQISLPYSNIVITFGWLAEIVNYILPILITFALFYTIFRFLSEKRIHPRASLIGALVYTFLFETTKYVLGITIEQSFSIYKYFYQGYAILFLLGVWAYYSSLIFVLSTIVARAYKEIYLLPSKVTNPYELIS